MKDEYISISEFAKRAGVSRQAIQQRLDKSLQGFVKAKNGRKWLNTKGLELFEGVNLAQGSTVENDKLAQGLIDLLKGELTVKDEQIRRLQDRVDELTVQNRELADQLLKVSGQVGSSLEYLTGAFKVGGDLRLQAGQGTEDAAAAEPKKRRWSFGRR